MAQVKYDVKKTGDLGIIAETSKSNQKTMFKPSRLTVKGVFDKLKDISEMTGHSVIHIKKYFLITQVLIKTLLLFYTYRYFLKSLIKFNQCLLLAKTQKQDI